MESRQHLLHAGRIFKPQPVNGSSHDFPETYEEFLEAFIQQGYEFIFFNELNASQRQLILRHDVDFDTRFALDAAIIEAEMGIRSTFFFLVRSSFYNILAPNDFENINRIKELGHKISVHFDPLIYDDVEEGLKQEVGIFQSCFQEEVDIISFHRPTESFRNLDTPLMGIEHTYQSKYFRDIKYFSDSTGVWRFGHPHESGEFSKKESLHILIHPIWWMVAGHSNLYKLETYFSQRIQKLKQEFSSNCIPFRQIEVKEKTTL
jgi:hypothetical protein